MQLHYGLQLFFIAAVVTHRTEAGTYGWKPNRMIRKNNGRYRYSPIEGIRIRQDRRILAVRVVDNKGNTQFLEPVHGKVSRNLSPGFSQVNGNYELEALRGKNTHHNRLSYFQSADQEDGPGDHRRSRHVSSGSHPQASASHSSTPSRYMRPPRISKHIQVPKFAKGYLPPVNKFQGPASRPGKNLTPPKPPASTSSFTPQNGASAGGTATVGGTGLLPANAGAAKAEEGQTTSQEVNPPGGADLRRNLSDRVDGSLFFGILPVPEGATPPDQGVPTNSGTSLLSTKPGRCPFVDMTKCPAPSLKDFPPTCSNDRQCDGSTRCCYNPCLAQNLCVQPQL